MKLRWVFVASLLITFCLLPAAAWAQGSNPATWPIVYQDDFQNPKSGWNTGETGQEAKGYVDGAYEIAVKRPMHGLQAVCQRWTFSVSLSI